MEYGVALKKCEACWHAGAIADGSTYDGSWAYAVAFGIWAHSDDYSPEPK